MPEEPGAREGGAAGEDRISHTLMLFQSLGDIREGIGELRSGLARVEERIGRVEERVGRVEERIGRVDERIEDVRKELDRKIESVRSWAIGILALAVVGLIVKLFLPTL